MSFASITFQQLLIALVAFTCLSTFPHFVEAGDATTPGQCNSVDDIKCPASDLVNAVSSGYNPRAVNWKGVLSDIESIGREEPRWCSFVIRAWFHDGSSIHGVKDDSPFNGGSEGSLFTDKREFTSPEGALHGWSPFARHVVTQISATHGASLTDIIMVSAAKCTSEVLGGTVDIADHCEAVGLPLSVGKLDREIDGSLHDNHVLNKMAHSIPAPGNRVGHLLNFFLRLINDHISEGNWKLDPVDVMALMGSHTIMMTQGCSTSGEQKMGLPMSDRTCGGKGGRQRMFSWDNSFFQDISAGKATQNSNDHNRREMSMQQAQDFRMCGFNSMEGFELGETLECSAMSHAEANAKNPEHPNIYWKEKGPWSKGWEHVKWQLDHEHAKPGNEPAPCCGHECEDCGTNPDSKFWCGTHDHVESAKGPGRMWPYTYMDSEFNWVYLKGGQHYCDGSGPFTCGTCSTSCKAFGDEGAMKSHIDAMQAAIEKFRNDRTAWEQAYAVAFCKMSEFGSNYADKTPLVEAINSSGGGGCMSPQAALSLKGCETCKMEEYGGFTGGSGGSAGAKAATPPPPVLAATDIPDDVTDADGGSSDGDSGDGDGNGDIDGSVEDGQAGYQAPEHHHEPLDHQERADYATPQDHDEPEDHQEPEPQPEHSVAEPEAQFHYETEEEHVMEPQLEIQEPEDGEMMRRSDAQEKKYEPEDIKAGTTKPEDITEYEPMIVVTDEQEEEIKEVEEHVASTIFEQDEVVIDYHAGYLLKRFLKRFL